MKHNFRFLSVFCAAVIFMLGQVGADAQAFSKWHALFQLQTGHFLIVFPEECRPEAERLAGFADDVYRDVCAELRTDLNLMLPVVISRDSQVLNGYFSNTFGNQIVLYSAPVDMDSELGNMKDDLRTVFMHELAHAISLNIKSPLWQFLSAVFGDFISPNGYLMMPSDFIEGVTVALESRDGFGRANDPFVLQAIRQDILEGKARDFYAAAGGDDRYPGGAIHYWYGGAFSTFLLGAFGAEKYAQLWQETGNGNVLAGVDGFLFFQGAFEKVYGLPLRKAWQDFLDSVAYKAPIVTKIRAISDDPAKISAFAARGDTMYWADSASGACVKRDGATGRAEKIFSFSSFLSRICPANDGSTLLLSWGKYEGILPSVFVRAWDERTRSFVGPEYTGLRDAAYVGDGGSFVALEINGFETDLVRVSGENRETLIHGSPSIAFADPCPLGGDSIAFLLKIDGLISVARMDLRTRAVEILKTDEPLGRISGLSSAGGRLVFSRATADEFPSLAVWGSQGLLLQKTALSGGVAEPVISQAGVVHYIGRFSDGMRVCTYPDDNPGLALSPVDSHWETLPLAAPMEAGAVESAAVPFNPLPWLLPQDRIPFFTLGPTGVDSLGVLLISSDPGMSWANSVTATYDWTRQFADLSLSFNISAPFSATIDASDQVTYDAARSIYMRRSSGGFDLELYSHVFPDNAFASLDIRSSIFALAPQAAGAATAYAWPYQSLFASAGLSAAFNGKRGNSIQPGQILTGLAGWLALDGGSPLGAGFSPAAAAQANAGFSIGSIGLAADFYAAATVPGIPWLAPIVFSPSGVNRADGTVSGIPQRYPVFREYGFFTPDPASAWYYACFDAGIMPLSADVMKAFPDFKLFVSRIALAGGYRGAITGNRYLDSVYARVLIQGNIPQSLITSTPLVIFGEMSYAIRAADFGQEPVSFGFGLQMGF
jgi:hypothetical protein